MKISPISLLNYRKPINTSSKQKLHGLKQDTVSFGIFMGYLPKDTQIYRCIGEEEYQKLLNNESISSSGFVTTNPQGWAATNWFDGFMPFNRGHYNHYFITFKKNRFSQIADFRDSIKDTKCKIFEDYSLDDIENIRKGNNAHGELVWAENFEEEKEKDILNKKETISWLIDLYNSNFSKIDKRKIKDELLSYQKEFPEIGEILN